MKSISDLTPYARAVIEEKTKGLLYRAGVLDAVTAKIEARQNVFRHASLLDLAKESAKAAGVNVSGMSPPEVVAAAFFQSSSDFPVLLENVLHKSMQVGYAKRAFSWRSFCRVVDLADFRDHRTVRIGSIGNLDKKNELGEFKYKSLPDGESDTLRAGTKGNIIRISRETIVNDSLLALTAAAEQLGEAAARTIEADVFALLAMNGGNGPIIDDGLPLFHANHKNIVSPAAAPSVPSFRAARSAFKAQTEPGTTDSWIDLEPASWLGPVLLEGEARIVNDSEFDTEPSNVIGRLNEVRNMFRQVIGTPRLYGTRWYAFADPAICAALQVGFIGGNESPSVLMQESFDCDGMQARVILDFGVAGADPRGAITNPGA
ncbi:hypothetical protein OPU71_07045 [Niveibacterium sp. 24ML]|uniref:phage major capsid protein n=1 Tax=Niveibacterium sp. 24ML TaxID=2985512 RepID=UPI00226D597D|nr:hypothetical protein [Niveibacterium sp. 24ML]MCX9155884.1 hypothetical protein [Niveibacterium sp. 24ML]